MRVLIIAELFPPDMGGGATRAYNVAKGLKANGCEVVVVSAFPHYPYGNIQPKYRWKAFVVEEYDGIKTIRTFVPSLVSKGLVNRIILFFSFMISALFAFNHVGKVDVILAANPNVLSFIPAFVFSIIKKAPVVLNVDDLWPEDLYMFGLLEKGSVTSRIAEFLASFVYARADAITPIS
ncbi:MAG: glycosyltransferase, partial [Candidatus Bathyarchaeota archaeon]|nr:glycosyltransferase [Candidatus Bathyarchaeota archaeon]